jgi:hypothetical protein
MNGQVQSENPKIMEALKKLALASDSSSPEKLALRATSQLLLSLNLQAISVHVRPNRPRRIAHAQF